MMLSWRGSVPLLLLTVLFCAARGGAVPYIRPRKRPLIKLDHGRGDGKEPEQIHLSLAGPRHMAISWVTPRSSHHTTSSVFYGPHPSELTHRATGEVQSYKYLAYHSGDLHCTVIGPLEPNATYYYRVGDPGVALSEVLQFETVPESGPDVRVRISIVGDLGQTEWSVETLEAMESLPTTVVIVAGDLSYADRVQRRWDSFGNLIQPLASHVPFMSLPGNHESESIPGLEPPFKAYSARYSMPFRESGSPSNLYYSFDVGSVHVVMLSSYSKFGPDSDQYMWLEADLAEVDRDVTPWLVASWHVPWYSSNRAHRGEGRAMRAALEDLLVSARVDAAFVGHVHAYERTERLYRGKPHECGIVHITIGDGGNREGLARGYLTPQPPWSVVQEASFGFGTFSTVNRTHTHWLWYRSQDVGREPGDSVWLRSLVSPETTCDTSD